MHVNFQNFKFYVRWQGSSIVQLETNHKYSCFTFLHLKSFWLGYVCLYLDFREKKGTIIAVQQWPPSKAGLGYARRQCWWNHRVQPLTHGYTSLTICSRVWEELEGIYLCRLAATWQQRWFRERNTVCTESVSLTWQSRVGSPRWNPTNVNEQGEVKGFKLLDGH